MPSRLREVQRKDGIVKSGGRAPHAPRESGQLAHAPLDLERLGRQTYLTVQELTAYLRFPSERACRMWLSRAGVPKCRRGGRTLLVLRRDVDNAVQPGKQRHADSVVRTRSPKEGDACSR